MPGLRTDAGGGFAAVFSAGGGVPGGRDFHGPRDGRLYVNGLPEDNPHARGATLPQTGIVEYPYTVGEDMVFLVGDNREGSVDSRTFGALPFSSIRGKLIGYGG